MTFLSNGVFLLSCCVRLAMYNKDQSVYIYRSIYLSYQDRLGTNEKGTLSTKRKTGCSVSRQRTTYRNVVPHVRRGDSALPPCPSHRLHGRDATPAEARLLFVRPLLLVASDVRVQSLSWQMITFQNENKTEKMTPPTHRSQPVASTLQPRITLGLLSTNPSCAGKTKRGLACFQLLFPCVCPEPVLANLRFLL